MHGPFRRRHTDDRINAAPSSFGHGEVTDADVAKLVRSVCDRVRAARLSVCESTGGGSAARRTQGSSPMRADVDHAIART
jgi:hypothetical protein